MPPTAIGGGGWTGHDNYLMAGRDRTESPGLTLSLRPEFGEPRAARRRSAGPRLTDVRDCN